MDTRRIELLLTVHAMLLALGVAVYADSARYYGDFELLAFLLPVAVLVGGGLFVGYSGVEAAAGWLKRDVKGVESR
ncbi:hypothetical protein SAMN04487950_1483 [Halogranum rubrum]|uniref:Uncharacterized protein n=1 Tax=Halogranum rubrum TaxID=553466 RepID=A0A1I4CYV3_9EURY|nr:hypothetical protein [Halogranum rubrum]SFK85963.1 hypothetical protein SAMN04487950_1483 [Halogranum rubrum]